MSEQEQGGLTPITHPSRVSEFIIQKLLDVPAWMFEGLCVPRRDLDFVWDAHFEQAKPICMACPVREQCLEEGIRGQNEEGMWGGEDIWDFLNPEIVAEREAKKARERAEAEPRGVEIDED